MAGSDIHWPLDLSFRSGCDHRRACTSSKKSDEEREEGSARWDHFIRTMASQTKERLDIQANHDGLTDYLAGWYAVETGMDNSTLLIPLEGERSDYVMINNARWNGLLSFMWHQFTKKSSRNYLQANLDANHVGARPGALY